MRQITQPSRLQRTWWIWVTVTVLQPSKWTLKFGKSVMTHCNTSHIELRKNLHLLRLRYNVLFSPRLPLEYAGQLSVSLCRPAEQIVEQRTLCISLVNVLAHLTSLEFISRRHGVSRSTNHCGLKHDSINSRKFDWALKHVGDTSNKHYKPHTPITNLYMWLPTDERSQNWRCVMVMLNHRLFYFF